MIDRTFYKVVHFYYHFTHRNVNSQFKNNLCEKGKADTRTPISRTGARHSFITEMEVFTLEADYLCETGYPFDNSRQIIWKWNGFNLEWTIHLTLSVNFDGQFEDGLYISDSHPPPPLPPGLFPSEKIGEGLSVGERATVHSIPRG